MVHSGDTRNLTSKSISRVETYVIGEEGGKLDEGRYQAHGAAGQSSCVQFYTYRFARVHVR